MEIKEGEKTRSRREQKLDAGRKRTDERQRSASEAGSLTEEGKKRAAGTEHSE